jgi:uncharacterized protein
VVIELTQDGDDTLLPVQAQPKARKNGVTGIHDGRLKVAVTQAPEKGKANTAIVKVLATALKLKRSQIHLESGATSGKKIFRIVNIQPGSLRKCLTEWVSR